MQGTFTMTRQLELKPGEGLKLRAKRYGMDWKRHIDSVSECLEALKVTDRDGFPLEAEGGFALLCDMTFSLRRARGTVFLVGNGASASMASHVAADLAKNVHLRTEVFSDLSLLTAIANDMSYEHVFAEPLRRRMCPGDMLVAISSSGNSPNVLAAALEAERLGGTVVTLSAMGQENSLRKMGSLNFYVPGTTYGLAESCHATILHYWIDHMVETAAARAD